jgi:hypothetical protein
MTVTASKIGEVRLIVILVKLAVVSLLVTFVSFVLFGFWVSPGCLVERVCAVRYAVGYAGG